MNEWKLFKSIYVNKFNDADTDKNLRLNKAEMIEGIKDIRGLGELIKNETIWEIVLNDISGRKNKPEEDYINFHEFVLLRATATAWTIASGMRTTITREELLDIGLKVFPHFNAYEG